MFRWCKADVIDDATKINDTDRVFSDVFRGGTYANDLLRPKIWYENDRKNIENLLKRKLEKMLIFDQKILEAANECKTQLEV